MVIVFLSATRILHYQRVYLHRCHLARVIVRQNLIESDSHVSKKMAECSSESANDCSEAEYSEDISYCSIVFFGLTLWPKFSL